MQPLKYLKETFMAKFNDDLRRTTQARPKSETHTPKRDDEHPYPFHMRSPFPPGITPSGWGGGGGLTWLKSQ